MFAGVIFDGKGFELSQIPKSEGPGIAAHLWLIGHGPPAYRPKLHFSTCHFPALLQYHCRMENLAGILNPRSAAYARGEYYQVERI
jgi:hypothetical protein